jgi:hypothetical protein
MTDATRSYTRADGSFDLFGAMENGQRLHRQAINISFRGFLARLLGKSQWSINKLTVSTIDKHG